MKHIYKIVLVVLAFFTIHHAKATHMMGSDITYRCLGKGKFKIIGKMYRDCRGIGIGGTNNFKIFCADKSVGSYSLPMKRTKIADITPKCSKTNSPCKPQNQRTGKKGVEEHTFEVIIDFNRTPYKNFVTKKCCEVIISFSECCRNKAINTGINGALFTYAMINICNFDLKKDCQSSPSLTTQPFVFACCNQPFVFNNGALDTSDFDSLSYKMDDPLGAWKSPRSYTSPLHKNLPVDAFCPPDKKCAGKKPRPNAQTSGRHTPHGFYLDPETGDWVVLPIKCNQVSVLTIKIEEWRRDSSGKMKIVGITRRDVQIWVDKCPDNNPPLITSKFKHSVCEGEVIKFDISAKDIPFRPAQTTGDTVQMDWNSGIRGGTFTIKNKKAKNKTATFEWRTKVGDAKDQPYTFTVTAKDDNCPIRATQVRSFSIKVNKKALATRHYKILPCGKLRIEAKVADDFRGRPVYKWDVRDSNLKLLKPRLISYVKFDTLQFQKPGKHLIKFTITNPPLNCPTSYTDTVIIPPFFRTEVKDTFVCFDSDIDFEADVFDGHQPYKFKWYLNDSLQSSTTNKLSIFKPAQDTFVIVEATDSNGCIDLDSALLRVIPLPVVDLGPDQRICSYDSATFDAGHNDTNKYDWKPYGDTTQAITINKPGRYIANVILKDYGCIGSDTAELFVNVPVVSNAGPDKEICEGDSVHILGTGTPYNYIRAFTWKNTLTDVVVSTDSALHEKPASTINYSLQMKVEESGLLCVNVDTVEVKVNPNPSIIFSSPKDVCWSEGLVNLHGATNVKPTYSQFINKYKVLTYPTLISRQITTDYLHIDSLPEMAHVIPLKILAINPLTGCKDSVNLNQKVFPNPKVKLVKKHYCQDIGEIPLSNSIKLPAVRVGGIESWKLLKAPGCVNLNTDVYDKNKFVPFSQPDWVLKSGDPKVKSDLCRLGKYELEYCYLNGLTQCQTCDTVEVSIGEVPVITLTPFDDACLNGDTIDLNKNVKLSTIGADPYDGRWEIIDPIGSTFVHDTTYGLPFTGSGAYNLRYTHAATGCVAKDSTEIYVNVPPQVSLRDDTMCSTAGNAPLNVYVELPTFFSPSDGIWSGDSVRGTSPSQTFEIPQGTTGIHGPYKLYFEYQNPITKCKNKDSMDFTVQQQPEITILTPLPVAACEGDTLPVFDAKIDYAIGQTWTTTGDGTIASNTQMSTKYDPGTNDILTGNLDMLITTDLRNNDKCPQASETIPVVIHAKPDPDFTAPLKGCAPMLAGFNSMFTRPSSGNVRYKWDFGQGDSSTDANPTAIPYLTEGKFPVTLTITNNDGNCATTITKPDYVEVYPVPKAAFESDPENFTTIALPKFEFYNKSSISAGTLLYKWDFGTGNPKDTSSATNPEYGYPSLDTASYYVTLITYSNPAAGVICSDTAIKWLHIGPDVTVFIPNAFTPDPSGEPKNNTFYPVLGGYKTMHMEIFNRWGEMLFETDDPKPENGWNGIYNGEVCIQDVYVYSLSVIGFDDKEYKYSGTVHLLR